MVEIVVDGKQTLVYNIIIDKVDPVRNPTMGNYDTKR
jgi:hypothetical protein